MPDTLDVIGAGLAGCEAAWQAAQMGIPVRLIEMRPVKMTPAHTTGDFAELVCSNSLRSDRLSNAVGLLKAEMEELDSIIIRCARKCSVPAGGALAVDRGIFSALVTSTLTSHPLVRVERREITDLSEWKNGQPVVIAAGPLASDGLASEIASLTGHEFLSFYDAAAPVVHSASINTQAAFWGSRYERGDDYLNCPMDKNQYLTFWQELVCAERAPVHGFETGSVFEGCMPIEVMAERGVDTMRFGPLKPKGLTDPRTGREPYAVVQLRKEDAEGTRVNLVGFQTRLKFGEQRRVFGLIPGLEHADFTRYGVMHRNTFLRAPGILGEHFEVIAAPWIRFAGQITGVEGYVESAASGLLAGLHAARALRGLETAVFTRDTALGALSGHVTNTFTADYQPSNISFGLMEPLAEKVRRKEERNALISRRALDRIRDLKQRFHL